LVSAGILITLMLTWAGWAVLPARHRTDYVLHVLPAGDGAATVLAAPDGSAAVIDVGTNTNSDAGVTAARALRASGVRQVDAAVISHGNVDHFSGLPSLMEHMPVQRWLTNADLARMHTNANPTLPAVAALRAACPPPATLRAGDHLTIGDAELDVLWPPADLDPRWSVNDCSLVIRLTTAGRTVLLPGDIEAPAMNVLLDAEHAGRLSLKADVLIAPHHGQVIVGLTANWLAAVSPQAVIVSSRTPRPKLIALVAEVLGPQARTLLTGEVGAIAVHVSPDGGLTIETPYAPVRF
jgi:competence protein ComEC